MSAPVGWHYGFGAPGCPLGAHRDHPQRAVTSPIDARRQRAREAGLDAAADDGSEFDWGDKLDAAIETATRVRIDDEIVRAALEAVSAGPAAFGRYHTAVKAAFKAAGFEVEQ